MNKGSIVERLCSDLDRKEPRYKSPTLLYFTAIFTCITNLEHLTHAEFLLADGRSTFSVTPKHFLQLYTIHRHCGGHYVPLVYVLLPNKQEGAYQQILDIPKQQCLTVGLNLSPAVIILDFEVSTRNVFSFTPQ